MARMIAGLSSAEYYRRWNAQDPKKRAYQTWKSALRRRYGITEEQYFEMWCDQDGLCDICGLLPQGADLKLCVDHNHMTGKARRLLCRGCNIIVGSLESPLLGRAQDYLRRYQ